MYDREHLARKTDLMSNLTDIFNRQYVAGDPGVRQYDKQVKLKGVYRTLLLEKTCITFTKTKCRAAAQKLIN